MGGHLRVMKQLKTLGLETRLAATSLTRLSFAWVCILNLPILMFYFRIKRGARFLLFNLSLITLFTASTACSSNSVSSHHQPVVEVIKADGVYTILRNGEPFVIQGVAGHEHLGRLKRMGGNTIRVYDTNNLGQILDSAEAHGLAVIAGIWMMGDLEMDYTDSFMVAEQYDAIKESVQRYRDHPALLMWCLGNEISYRASFQELFFPRKMWLAFEDLVDMIHEEDPNHPVTTTITNFQRKRLLYFKFRVPQLDLVGINTFGRIKTLKQMSAFYNWFFDMPYFLAEWAIRGPWESADTKWDTPIEKSGSAKARKYVQYYQEFIPHSDPRFLGSCVFYWGQKQEHTHSWFSLFTSDGKPTPALQALEEIWTGKKPGNRIVVTDSLLLNGKSSQDNIILNPGELVQAHLFAYDYEDDLLETEWEILPDSWHFDYRAINYKPAPLEGLIQVKAKRDLKFVAPSREGSYRLFAKVSDSGSGGASLINTTFLVVQ